MVAVGLRGVLTAAAPFKPDLGVPLQIALTIVPMVYQLNRLVLNSVSIYHFIIDRWKSHHF